MTTRLVQPLIPRPSAAPEVDWWFTGLDASISRNEIHALWISDVMTNKPIERKTFGIELNAWARELSDTDWVADEFHPTVPTLLGSAAKAFGDVEGWNSYSVITAAFTEPLSFYTTGWYAGVATLRPDEKLPSKVCSQIREMARRVAKPVREDMVQRGTVRTSAAAQQFITVHAVPNDANSDSMHRRHARIALSHYQFRLAEYLRGLALQKRRDDKLRGALAAHYLDIVAELSIVSGGGAMAASDFMPEFGVGSELNTDSGNFSSGHPRVSKVETIQTDRLAGWPSLFDSVGDLEVLLRAARLRTDARIRISRDPTLRVRDALVWEAEFTMDFLADPAADVKQLDAAVVARWAGGRPRGARTTDAKHAARDVEIILVSALRAVRRLGGG